MVDANAYFAANPDVAAAFAQNNYGLTPDQFAATHYNLYGAAEQRAQPTIATSAPSVQPSSSLPPPPTWMDAFNKWNVEQNLPERAAKGYTTPDMWAWNTDAEHKKVKDLLDKQYLENVRQYNAIYGTDIKPDTSVLGSEAQPNQTYYTPDEGGGLFGGGGFLGTGFSTSDIGKLALLAGGAYAGGLFDPTSLAATGAGSDAAFVAADAAQLAGQGLSQAAIEQNLTAAGVDSFIAADAAQLAAQGIKGTQLEGLLTQSAGGTSIFAPAAAAAEVTSGVTGATPTPTTEAATPATGTGLTASQAANLAKLGLTTTGLLGGAKAVSNLVGGNTGTLSLNPQNRAGIFSGSANYSPEYYQAIQSKYNQLMPNQPRDVTTELKNWYETKFAPKVA